MTKNNVDKWIDSDWQLRKNATIKCHFNDRWGGEWLKGRGRKVAEMSRSGRLEDSSLSEGDS